MKYTTGPWVGEGGGVKEIPLQAISCERLGFQIVFINTDKQERREEAEANARLICAAPCLVEALKYARRFMKEDFYDLEYIDSVIYLATGEVK